MRLFRLRSRANANLQEVVSPIDAAYRWRFARCRSSLFAVVMGLRFRTFVFPPMKTMNSAARVWTINGDFVALQPTGVARYAREVTLALDALVGSRHLLTRGLEIRLVAPRLPEDLPLKTITVRVVPEFDKPRLPQFWVQAQLPNHVEGGLLSFCNLAPMFIRRHIVCIHDLHTWIMPESYGLLFRLAHRIVLPILGRNAACVATVSELSREYLGHYGIAAVNKTVVTYNGSDHALRWNARKSGLSLGARPFVLYFGRSQRYKNGELIWRIAPHLDDLGLDVYVVGALDSESVASFGPKIPGNVRLLGRISDDDLAKLFTHALCFLFPSRIEGFGLPAVEAMVHGCPVVASNAPCLPEVCGDAALFVDPEDDQGWVRQVRRLKLEADLRTALIARGRTRAGRFIWGRIAEQYLSLMQKIDSELCGVRDDSAALQQNCTNAKTPEVAVSKR
jgi:glycosyltransferase involved in cell wall biosynthesis